MTAEEELNSLASEYNRLARIVANGDAAQKIEALKQIKAVLTRMKDLAESEANRHYLEKVDPTASIIKDPKTGLWRPKHFGSGNVVPGEIGNRVRLA